MAKLSKIEQNWQVEEDARTFERYQELINNKSRLNNALKKVKENASTLEKRSTSLNNAVKSFKKK